MRGRRERLRVLVGYGPQKCATVSDTANLRRAMEAGASGFLLNDAPAGELARAIRAAAAGERVVDPGLAAAALTQGENPLTARAQPHGGDPGG